MVHWGFLILAFLIGFIFCYALLYQIAKIAARIEGAIEEGCKRIYA